MNVTAGRSGLRGLYVITDEHLMPEADFFHMVEQALRGGACIVQLRDKRHPDNKMLKKALTLRKLCEEYGAIFIVNDHLDIAVESGAHGLHVGEEDCDISQARERMKSGIIGVSCYNDFGRALSMASAGADYVAFGSFFPSPTKPQARRAGIELLGMGRDVLNVPVCAIGGITAVNVHMLVNAGADMTAVISDIWKAEDIKGQAERFVEIFQKVYG